MNLNLRFLHISMTLKMIKASTYPVHVGEVNNN